MNNKKLLALYGLKWNPFTPELPIEALWATPRTEEFARRVENLVSDGGFALITGDTGSWRGSDRTSSCPWPVASVRAWSWTMPRGSNSGNC